jgi:hypothetical protein
MIRLGTFVWLAVLTLIGVGLYQVELGVLAKEAELKQINHQIDADREAVHVLDAEWSYLNDPTRLTDLARRYTDLAPVTPTQIAGFDRLLPRAAPIVAGVPPFERDWPIDPLPADKGAPNAPTPNAPTPAAPPLIASARPATPTPQTQPAPSPTAAVALAQPAAPTDGIGAIIAASETTITKIPSRPTDEQAQADDTIAAILADMKKAQQQ